MPLPSNPFQTMQLQEDFRRCQVHPSVLAPAKRPELFRLPTETLKAISSEEITATYRDMRELGIAKLPYPIVDVGVPADHYIRLCGEDGTPETPIFEGWELRFRLYGEEEHGTVWLISPRGFVVDYNRLSKIHAHQSQNIQKALNQTAGTIQAILIVLLATKNAVKDRVKDKTLGMGIGAKKEKNATKALYTTTISVPTVVDDHEDAAEGSPKRPHLRRGHIRNQKHGPKLQFTKTIWIEPTFVNCDETFISSRTAYNTTLGA